MSIRNLILKEVCDYLLTKSSIRKIEDVHFSYYEKVNDYDFFLEKNIYFEIMNMPLNGIYKDFFDKKMRDILCILEEAEESIENLKEDLKGKIKQDYENFKALANDVYIEYKQLGRRKFLDKYSSFWVDLRHQRELFV